MTLEMFPNEYVNILLGVIEDNPSLYKLISYKDNGSSHTDIEMEGINSPFDLLALGIKIGIDYADINTINRLVPEVVKLVSEDIKSQTEPSEN